MALAPLVDAALVLGGELMVNSRAKGGRGEREIVEILNAHGYDTHRSPHSGALEWARGDIVGAPWHIEVKFVEAARIWDWCKQAEEQAGKKIPLVMFRRSREPWRVCLRLGDFLKLMERGAE